MLLSTVLDTKGEGVGGGILLQGGDLFLNLGTKSRFWCIIMFKVTSILAQNIYDCSYTREETVDVVK